MFDINSLEINETAEMPVRNAAGEKQYGGAKPLTITVHGPASRLYQQIKHQNEERNSTRLVAKMQGKDDSSVTMEDKAEEKAEQLDSITISFNNFGSGSLAGHELFLSVYKNQKLGHIADDVERFVNARASFMKPSTQA